jgi:hypothetical protein
MGLELPSIQTLGSLWNWAKDNIEVWCRAMGSLKDVVSGSDPNQYSLWCVLDGLDDWIGQAPVLAGERSVRPGAGG